MSQQMPSDRELEFRKLQNAHEVAMHQARTERLRAQTEHAAAMTARLKIIMNFVLVLTLLSLDYVTDARMIPTANIGQLTNIQFLLQTAQG